MQSFCHFGAKYMKTDILKTAVFLISLVCFSQQLAFGKIAHDNGFCQESCRLQNSTLQY